MDVQFDWLCDFRRYVDVLQRFVRSLLVIVWLKKVAISSKENYGGVELVVDH